MYSSATSALDNGATTGLAQPHGEPTPIAAPVERTPRAVKRTSTVELLGTEAAAMTIHKAKAARNLASPPPNANDPTESPNKEAAAPAAAACPACMGRHRSHTCGKAGKPGRPKGSGTKKKNDLSAPVSASATGAVLGTDSNCSSAAAPALVSRKQGGATSAMAALLADVDDGASVDASDSGRNRKQQHHHRALPSDLADPAEARILDEFNNDEDSMGVRSVGMPWGPSGGPDRGLPGHNAAAQQVHCPAPSPFDDVGGRGSVKAHLRKLLAEASTGTGPSPFASSPWTGPFVAPGPLAAMEARAPGSAETAAAAMAAAAASDLLSKPAPLSPGTGLPPCDPEAALFDCR